MTAWTVKSLVVMLVCVAMSTEISGHGYLLEPPGRSSMWRVGFSTPPNYNDNALFCGGYANQHYGQGGRCGICGDPFQGPRENEAGGRYATGIISRHYTQGQVIPVTVVITANHLGWFEFKLCPNNNINRPATHDCLDRHVLQLADGSGSKLHIGQRRGHIDLQLKLPADVTCSQCVLQWRYHAGNNAGTDADGHSCLGCGAQEEFYSCSDISISPSSAGPSSNTTTTPTLLSLASPLPSVVVSSETGGSGSSSDARHCIAVSPMWRGNPRMDRWCQDVCLSSDGCPAQFCLCN